MSEYGFQQDAERIIPRQHAAKYKIVLVIPVNRNRRRRHLCFLGPSASLDICRLRYTK
jgi:hypothetical protein